MRLAAGLLLAALGATATAGAGTTHLSRAAARTRRSRALIARGNALYTLYCRACHGVDLRGGDLGGPNLLRSQLVLNDQGGDAIGPVVRAGRVPAAGGTPMPPHATDR